MRYYRQNAWSKETWTKSMNSIRLVDKTRAACFVAWVDRKKIKCSLSFVPTFFHPRQVFWRGLEFETLSWILDDLSGFKVVSIAGGGGELRTSRVTHHLLALELISSRKRLVEMTDLNYWRIISTEALLLALSDKLLGFKVQVHNSRKYLIRSGEPRGTSAYVDRLTICIAWVGWETSFSRLFLENN